MSAAELFATPSSCKHTEMDVFDVSKHYICPFLSLTITTLIVISINKFAVCQCWSVRMIIRRPCCVYFSKYDYGLNTT